MDNNPKVSVIITTYRRPFYLKRAFYSVTLQTYQPSEIIIVNDDPFHQFNACDFASNHVPLILNHSTNKGASAARNTGLLHTSGDIICFLDDDDLWLPTYLESQVESLSNTSPHIGFSYSHSLVLNSKNSISNRLRPTISGNIFDLQLISHRITNISCVAIKSTVLDLVPMFDVDLPRGNDSDFIRQLSYYFHCVCVPKLLVLYNFDENLPRITSFVNWFV